MSILGVSGILDLNSILSPPPKTGRFEAEAEAATILKNIDMVDIKSTDIGGGDLPQNM